MAELICHCCGVIAEPIITERGPHLRADCSACGRYIKFVPRERPSESPQAFRLFSGKHAGRTLEEVDAVDPGYIRWSAESHPNATVQRACGAFLAMASGGPA